MFMEPVLLHSASIPFVSPLLTGRKISIRHSNKHLQCKLTNSNLPRRLSSFSLPTSLSLKNARNPSFTTLNCSLSDTSSSESQNPFLLPFKTLSLDSVKTKLSQLTPFDVVKWSAVLSVVIAATKWTVNLFLNPFFWMYFSWTWIFWPWIVAIAVAAYGIYCYWKHLLGEANTYEQLSVVTSVFTWLTLVPPAYFNGFLEGWPFVFFFVYHYFFFFNVSIRRRLYGDYNARPHDPKWDLSLPKWHRLLFSVGIMIAHWLAAFEGPELHQIAGRSTWSNIAIWVLIFITLMMHYNSSLYLAKYSEKVVEPTAVVQFGPYRWVRHPIYASVMLLFATYFIALGSKFSLLFVVAVCLLYYGQKAKLEEALMVETFGARYIEYANKVRYKFIPFVY